MTSYFCSAQNRHIFMTPSGVILLTYYYLFARSKSSSPAKSVRREKMRSEEPEDRGGEDEDGTEVQCLGDENLCIVLSQQVG